MLSIQLAVVALAAAGAPDVVLLDFHADWCGPCRKMAATVDELSRLGYPIRRVNIDKEPELAGRFKVQSIPCFVLTSQGRQVDRVEGIVSIDRLRQMFTALARQKGEAPPAVRGQSPDLLPRTLPGTISEDPMSHAGHDHRGDETADRRGLGAAPARLVDRLMAASVRIKIEDPDGHSYGSGTIIAVIGNEALILTCAHIFRDSKGKGRITVDQFGDGAPRGVAARMIGYDGKSDVGLVSMRCEQGQPAIPVAPAEYEVRTGDAVINIGCNNGDPPTARQSRVASLNKFIGPANLQVSGQPVTGRSGGGLFSVEGLVIGVCNAADPADDEGLYAALESIHNELDRAKLSHVYRREGALVASADETSPRAGSRERGVPNMPDRMPPFARSLPLATSEASGRRAPADDRAALTAEEAAFVAEVHGKSESAEVICIIRSLGDPRAKSEIIVLDRASPEFLEMLTADRRDQDARHLTSLDVPRERAAAPRQAPRRPQPRTGSDWRPSWRQPTGQQGGKPVLASRN